MIFNIHTHTYRCHHASGDEREYIENAIASGIKVLGFSEHIPCPFPDGHESNFRLFKSDVNEYFTTLRALRDEYADKIEIHVGFECEYYPKYFNSVLEYIAPYKPEYLLLGQHFTGNEEDGVHTLLPSDDEDFIRSYAEQVCEGMRTGKFTYVAHPDIINYTGSDEIYRKYMIRICETAKKLGIPLEFNFLGMNSRRIYPTGRFFSIAAEVGNDIILGCDAHKPQAMLANESEPQALEFLSQYGITPIEKTEINYLEW